MKIKNKKAMELALGTVIIIVILLLVLIVVGSYFLGGITKTGEKIESTAEELTEGEGGVGDIKGKLNTVIDKFNIPEETSEDEES